MNKDTRKSRKMKNNLHFNHWLPKSLSKLPGMRINAIVLFYTAYFYQPEEEVSERLLRHEKEHIRQQEEEGFLWFLINYISEFLINYVRYFSFQKAYRNIIYEIEARKAERDI